MPTCTILPPGFPGYLKYCAYNSNSSSTYAGPDIAKAKALVQASGTAGEKVAVVAQNDPVDESVGEYIQGVLNQIGYKATLKPLSQNIEFNYIQNTNNKVQISVTQWFQDYPAASDFLKVLLNCSGFHKASDNSINISGLCDKSVDATRSDGRVPGVDEPDRGQQALGTDRPDDHDQGRAVGAAVQPEAG